MRVKVSTLTGKCTSISINQTQLVGELQGAISNVLSVPIDEQKLLYNGKILEEGTLFENGLIEDSCIYLLVSLEGGKGKKKKKKTKKNKPKHKKKKVKLAILNYFKYEDGKVVRLRQRSPTGTFMAEHSDRYYCGRSHITYKKKEEKAEQKTEKPAKTEAPTKKGKGK